MTDHTGRMPGTPDDIYFRCQGIYPDQLEGVYLIRGCEVNIVGYDGTLDLPDSILDDLDWVIASFHDVVIDPADTQSHTRAWLRIAENPLVDVIGHSGNGLFPFEKEPVIRAFAKYGKIVEINAHSFISRPGSAENCAVIARLCAEYRVPVVICSDAHFHRKIGYFDPAVKMLEEIGFPEELILNADAVRFARVLYEKSGRIFDLAEDP